MPHSRREFIGTSLATTGVLALGPLAPELFAASESANGVKSLRILILGGTGFIGPAVVRHAIQRGHTVTLFNRGRTNTHLFPDVEKLVGVLPPIE